MALKPLGSRVLVRMEKAESKSSSGRLFIPETAQEKTQTGIVDAIGSSDEITVTVGQKIMYDKYAGTNVSFDSVEYLIVKMEDIIAVVE